MKDHLSPTQRNQIRYHIRATEQGIARKYGISVATVRDVRRRAQSAHPARLAAITRRWERTQAALGPEWDGGQARFGGLIRRAEVPAVQTQPVKGQGLHVEGGADLPAPLG